MFGFTIIFISYAFLSIIYTIEKGFNVLILLPYILIVIHWRVVINAVLFEKK